MTTFKKILKTFNGWFGFAIASALFFIAPPVYRIFDPTAGQFDAGYLHPIIYAACVLCFGSGLAFALVFFTAPGLHKAFDEFLESDGTRPLEGFKFSMAKMALIMFLVFTFLFCATVWFTV